MTVMWMLHIHVTSDYDFSNLDTSSACGAGGSLTVTYTVADDCGNEATITVTLTLRRYYCLQT